MKNNMLILICICTAALPHEHISGAEAIDGDTDSTAVTALQHAEAVRLLDRKNGAPSLKRQTNSAMVVKEIDVSAGGLSAALTLLEKSTVTDLTITGSLDARDFKTMRDSIKNLQNVDIRGVAIHAYTGTEGSGGTSAITYAINTIPRKAFYMNRTVTSITLPVTITVIGYDAFCGCKWLASITIPTSVTKIDDFAFFLSGLISTEIPSSVDSIGVFACSGLAIVDPGNRKYSSSEGVLFNKNATVLIYFPTLKEGNYTVPSSVSIIDNFSFTDCTLLTSVTLSPIVTSIGAYSFEGCRGLTSFAIPPSVASIGSGAFQYCDGLTTLNVPASVKSIGGFALSCNAFITVDESNPYFCSENGVLFNKTKTTLIQCPTSKTGIYMIPSSVRFIGDHAFQLCERITSITIPPSVTSIGGMGLYRCSKLSSLYACSTVPVNVTSYAVFNEINKNTCILFVPAGSKSAYQAASQWKDFSNITEIVSEIALSTTAITIGAAANSTATFNITTTIDWKAESDKDWLCIIFPTGSGNATTTLIAKANPADSARMATIIVYGTGVVPKTLTVKQLSPATGVKKVSTADNRQNPSVVFKKPYLSFSKSLFHASVALYSLNGTRVYSSIIDDKNEIDMSRFTPGLYFVKIVSRENGIISSKVIQK